MALPTNYVVKTFADIYNAVLEESGIQATDLTALNRIKRDINSVYLDEVVADQEWTWLNGQVTLSTVARIAAGTAAISQNSRTVTLTVAPTVSQVGKYFALDAYNEIYRVTQHTAGSTTLTLDTEYNGANQTAANYKLWTDRLPLPPSAIQTTQVTSDWMDEPLTNQGPQLFRRTVASGPKSEGRPAFYTSGEWIQPNPYTAITSLPALSTRASSGLVKTLVFATDVSALLQVGDRIQVTGSSQTSYNGEFVVSSVATTTITYTGLFSLTEAAVADASLALTKAVGHTTGARYRELMVYPSIYSSNCTLHVNFIKEALPLANDTDEPLMPINDRMVIVYGALVRTWGKLRNDTAAKNNEALYLKKLARMAGRLEDTTDFPILSVSKVMLSAKRRPNRASAGSHFSTGFGGSSSGQVVTGIASRAAYFDTTGNLASSPVTTTELGRLSGVGSQVDGISDARTLSNKTISGASNTLTAIADTSLSSSYIKADGSRPLTANWSTGGYNVVLAGGALTGCSVIVSNTPNTSPIGFMRLAQNDAFYWRNIGNTGNLALGPSVVTDGVIQYNGVDLVGTTLAQTMTNKTLTAPVLAGASTTGLLTLGGTLDVGNNAITNVNSLQSITANLAGTGIVRLARTDTIAFRNNANSADLPIGVSASNRLQFNSVDLVTTSSTDTLTNKTLTAPVISTISNTGTLTLPTSTDTLVGKATTDVLTNKSLTSPTLTGSINLSGLTASQAVVTDGSKNLTSLGYATANTVSTLVQRDGSGNFAAGTITATLTGNVTGNVTGNLTGTVTGHSTLDLALTGGTMSGYITASSSTSGIAVETARSSPSSADTQNVYSGTYTPTLARSGATFSGIKTSYWYRVGNMVHVQGYADMTAGGTTNPITISLPITPSAFSSGNTERSEASGTCHLDVTSSVAAIYGNSTATTVVIEGIAVGNAANGLRYNFTYRIS